MPLLLSQALWINALSCFAIQLPLSAAGLGLREALALALLMLAMTLGNAVVGALLQWGARPVAAVRPATPG